MHIYSRYSLHAERTEITTLPRTGIRDKKVEQQKRRTHASPSLAHRRKQYLHAMGCWLQVSSSPWPLSCLTVETDGSAGTDPEARLHSTQYCGHRHA